MTVISILHEKVLVGYTAMMSFTMMENKTGPKTGLVSNKMSSFRPPDSAKSVTSETQTSTDNPAESNPRSTPKERCGSDRHLIKNWRQFEKLLESFRLEEENK